MEKFHPMMWSLFVFMLITTQACTTIPSNNAVAVPPCPSATAPEQCFDKPQDALAGMARVYIFRSSLGENYIEDAPLLIVDNTFEVTLGPWRYAAFDLALGKHSFRLVSAGDGKHPSIWNLEGELDVKEPRRYYLVIWNALATKSEAKSKSKSSKRTNFKIEDDGQHSAIVMVGGLPIPVFGGGANINLNEYVKYELIDEQQALESIRQCKLSAPKKLDAQSNSQSNKSDQDRLLKTKEQ